MASTSRIIPARISKKLTNEIQETSKDVLMIETFTNSKGEPIKGIEIYRLSNMAEVKNLKELKQLIGKQKKRGFVELNK